MENNKCSGHGLVELLKDKGKIKGIEIGCDMGTTTVHLLKTLPDIQLYGIDPFENYIDWNSNRLYERENTYKTLIENTTLFGDRFKLYRQKSDDAVSNFEDETLDFIFIDGIHTYEQVKKDCENYYPKIKKGGLFSGHDYNVIADVQKAVKEFAINSGQKQIFLTDVDVWYWFK